MNRKEFIKRSTALGIGIPFLSVLLESCNQAATLYPNFDVNFSGNVLVIGAGAAGITAGYILNKHNIDFQILEASVEFGGRLKRSSNFADFPIDLGAEWIHEDPSVLAKLTSNPNIASSVDIITYTPDTVYTWNNDKLRKRNWGGNFYSEYKFKSTTWFGFFEKYMIPNIVDKIRTNSPVTEIDYKANKVKVKNSNGESFEADKVLITVPIKILQEGNITFIPELPSEKIDAINSIVMPDGLKVFIEFAEKFYPDILFTGGFLTEVFASDKLFYNAAFRKNSERNIMGLFTVGDKASVYTSLETDEKIIEKVMEELDTIFEGKASQHYQKHIIQNWSREPYIQGSYSIDFANDPETTVANLIKPLDNKIYFAGEALSLDNGSTVPGAVESSYATVETMLAN
ncbi:MAG: FAD-dependent oxidoreductase [Bacteroidia bacterium]|nr:FAD-dependent oxidoreductase [Bacteroidia bacterium]